MSLSAEILCRIVGIETDTADIAKNTRITKAEYFKALADGTSTDQAQVVYSDIRTSGGTDTFQLSSLADTRDGASVLIAFTAAKVLYIENTHDSNTITVSGSYSGSVPPGGMLLAVNPTATGTTASALFLASTAGTTYKIVIVGEGSIV